MRSGRFTSPCAFFIAAFALASAPDPGTAKEPSSLLLVTTTSVRDSGLLDDLLPLLREQAGIEPQVVAVGSGAALRMGAQGNADVLVTHAPSGEKELVTSGAAASRTPFMENHFVIAGPDADPAGVREAATPAEALRRIRAAESPFVSRGDDSGTHRREVSLFREAGLDPDVRWPGFVRTGTGMGVSLQVAGEKSAYVLSDLGTFLAFRDRTGLVSLARPAPSLRNVYSVIRIDSEHLEAERAESAESFEQFLLSPETQQRIAAFGRERFGRSLFRPIAEPDAPPGP